MVNSDGFALLVGTIKGAFVLRPGAASDPWTVQGPWFLGAKVHDFRLDPRDGRTLLLSASGGHLGPTIQRSTNRGKTWKEATRPPAFAVGKRTAKSKTSTGLSVAFDFWISPGHADRPGEWYVGTSPTGLFKSVDGGVTWDGVAGLNENPLYSTWFQPDRPGSPEGSLTHSVAVDPRDPDHVYVSVSSGGTFESRDGGRSFSPLNRGVAMDFQPGEPGAYGHDVHCMVIAPSDPDVLYQQNHCGIYRLDRRGGEVWDRIGRKMPKSVGDIGFPICVHPRDADVAYVFPMDGTKEWSRTPPKARPAVFRTANGGRTWKRLDAGFPAEHGYLTVKRQAMDLDDADEPRVFLGTTTGTVFGSVGDDGAFQVLAQHLPHVYSVRAVRFP